MTFAQGMFFAHYIIFALAEKPWMIIGGLVLALLWGFIWIMEARDSRTSL